MQRCGPLPEPFGVKHADTLTWAKTLERYGRICDARNEAKRDVIQKLYGNR
jgi:hypothetical protein